MKTERETFASRLGFLLVSAGCAVGLGNVWKFPYMCGQYGGAAFILIYLVFLVILGIPVMTCELAVGRASRQSCATSFKVLEKKGANTHQFGYFGMIGNYMLMMFYTMVAGWLLYYCFRSLRGDFMAEGLTVDDIGTMFGNMVSSWQTMTFWTIVIIVVALGICGLGVRSGVEAITKYMMIILFALILILAVHSVRLPGAGAGLAFYLVPDFRRMVDSGIGNVVFGALSQAFFTLSLGIGSIAIFGSYMEKKRSVTGESVMITVLDTFVAITAGLIVIPACFAFGVDQTAGPSLIFITLPTIFHDMNGGQFWGTLFFLFMTFAALSTVVAVFENIVSFAIDLAGWSRKKAVLVNIVLISVLSMPCILGFNVLANIQPLGEGTGIMDLEDFIVSNNLLPMGSLVYVLFSVTKRGWGWDNFLNEVNTGEGLKLSSALRTYMTYILPVIIAAVYLKGYWDFFAGRTPGVRLAWMAVAVAFLALVVYLVFSGKREQE